MTTKFSVLLALALFTCVSAFAQNRTLPALTSSTATTDGKTQPIAGITTTALANQLKGAVTPIEFGAKGNGSSDDTAAVQAAIDSAAARHVTLDLGGHVYGIASALTASQLVIITGSGGGSGLYGHTCTEGFRALRANLSLLTLQAPQSEVSHVCFESGPGVSNTGGYYIKSVAGANSSKIADSSFYGGCLSVIVTGSSSMQNVNSVIDRNIFVPAQSALCTAVELGSDSKHGLTVDTVVSNNEIYCHGGTSGAVGMLFSDASGYYVTNNDIYACSYGTKLYPGASQIVGPGFFTNTVLGDTPGYVGMLVKTSDSTAQILSNKFVNTWATSSANRGPAILVNQVNGRIRGTSFTSLRAYNATGATNQDIVDIQGGWGTRILNSAVCLQGNADRAAGISITRGARYTAIQNNEINGACDLAGGVLGTAIKVDSTIDEVQIDGNDIGEGVTTPIDWNKTSNNINAVVGNNIGVDTTVGSVASAATLSLPANPIVKITGTTPVKTLNGAWNGRVVQIITSNGLTFTKGGNICNASDLTTAANGSVTASWGGGLGCWMIH